jgi:hypothetical protein
MPNQSPARRVTRRIGLARSIAQLIGVPIRIADDYWLKESAPLAKPYLADGSYESPTQSRQ